MRNFWGYVSNGEFSVGCTGRTVFIYDKDNNEIGQFKDITYGYTPMISPDGKTVVVKSTEGRFAVYSLETFSLIKKFRYSKCDYSQDDGFCFSPDSKFLINVERQIDDLHSAISVYDTTDFSLVGRMCFDKNIMLHDIEYDVASDSCYVLGFERFEHENKGFVAQVVDLQLNNITYVSREDYKLYHCYKDMEIMGFTSKKYKWTFSDYSLEELKAMNCSLAGLYKRYNS